MRITRGLVALLLLLPAMSSAQAKAADEKKVIAKLEDDWVRGVIARDTALFNRLLGPGFVYSEDDQLYTRPQVLRDLATTTDTVTDGRNEDLVVRVHGTTAIATGWLVLIGHGKAGAFQRRYRYTDTWVKRQGAWRIIAAHDYLKK